MNISFLNNIKRNFFAAQGSNMTREGAACRLETKSLPPQTFRVQALQEKNKQVASITLKEKKQKEKLQIFGLSLINFFYSNKIPFRNSRKCDTYIS